MVTLCKHGINDYTWTDISEKEMGNMEWLLCKGHRPIGFTCDDPFSLLDFFYLNVYTYIWIVYYKAIIKLIPVKVTH